MHCKLLNFCLLFSLQVHFLGSLILQSNKPEPDELNFFATRYYDPKLGQFAMPDTQTPGNFFLPVGLNRFLYAFGNPLKYNDPDGHHPQDPSNDSEFLRITKKSKQDVLRFHNSDQGFFDKLRFSYDSYQNAKAYRKYMSREVLTGIGVLDNPDVPNSGPIVAQALQSLIGDYATINAQPTTLRINGDVSNMWLLTYNRNPDRLSEKFKRTPSGEAWSRLRKAFVASKSYLDSSRKTTTIKLETFDSNISRRILRQTGGAATTLTIGFNIDIRVIADVDRRHRELGLPQRYPLAVVLGHELKHAQRYSEGVKNDIHPSSLFEFIVKDEPAFAEDNIYSRSYSVNNPGDPIPPTPPTSMHVAGIGIRKAVFEPFGIYPTKMKPQRE